VTEAIVPRDWKLANVAPIFKGGSRKDPGNYRPVSLTSHISKIFEKILKEHIVQFFEDNAILSSKQHGFRKGFSCLTSLLEACNCWTTYLDEGDPCDVLFLDLRKAFDSVCHDTLLRKLSNLGIAGSTLTLIESFITSRLQRVSINGISSEWASVTSGVPQGTVLGPVLFLAYINDAPDLIINLCNLFADDLKLFRRITNFADCQSLQNDIDSLVIWAKNNKLTFNANKSAVLHLGRTNMNYDYKIGDISLPSPDQAKSLGVIFNRDLKVGTQCRAAASKANQMLGRIKKNFQWLTPRTLRILYTTYVRPHLDYCSPAWNPYLIKDINTLEAVQRRATRLLPSIRHLPYDQRLHHLGLTSLADRRLRGALLEAFKIVNHLDHRTSDDYFREATNLTTRGHQRKLYTPYARTLVRKNFFSVGIIRHWNALPAHLTEGSDLKKWKRDYDKWKTTT